MVCHALQQWHARAASAPTATAATPHAAAQARTATLQALLARVHPQPAAAAAHLEEAAAGEEAEAAPQAPQARQSHCPALAQVQLQSLTYHPRSAQILALKK